MKEVESICLLRQSKKCHSHGHQFKLSMSPKSKSIGHRIYEKSLWVESSCYSVLYQEPNWRNVSII